MLLAAVKTSEKTDVLDSVASLPPGVNAYDHSTDQLYVATMRELQFGECPLKVVSVSMLCLSNQILLCVINDSWLPGCSDLKTG